MSIIKSIKQVLGLHPAAENHFWDGSVANQLTLKKGTPDVPGAEVLAVDSTGKVGFSVGILGFSYSVNPGANNAKALRFPSWLNSTVIQWGAGTPSGEATNVPLGDLMADTEYSVFVTPDAAINASSSLAYSASNKTTSSFAVITRYINDGGAVGVAVQPFMWMVIGKAA